MKTKLLLSLIFALCASSLWSYDVIVDGIYYNIVSKLKTAEVTRGDNSYYGVVNIPSSIEYGGETYSVISIDRLAFNNCSSLTSVVIPNSVTNIGNYAFNKCSSLTTVNIPNSVTNIGEYAFDFCERLTSVHISNIEYWCKIKFEGRLANPLYFAHHLYLNDSEIRELVIPNSINCIGGDAFSGCSGLTSVVIPNSVTSIGEFAFSDCSSLTTVNIPNSVTNIGEWAFENCSALTSVVIPNSVTNIGHSAFACCSGLTSIVIPNSVTSIGFKAFYGCSGLTSVVIPNSVTSIDATTFYGCSGLTSVIIPNSVTSINKYAFKNCSGLTSVVIPNSVTNIGECAFEGCKNLADVYCYADKIPDTNSESFKDSYIEYCTLYVPESAIDLYKSVSPWSSFGTIKSIESSDITLINIKAKAMTYNLNGSIQNEKTNGFNIILNSNGNSQKVFVK